MDTAARKPESSRSSATMVAAGILLSRITGLVRDRVFAHYFGNSDAADAFRAAFRIPNFLQNLFGEGVLSASFIPVYARLNAEQRFEEARRVAKAVFALLFLTTSLLVLAGVWATPWLIQVIAPGFHGDKRELTIHLVRIFFPGAGLLVFGAWCLGILNSHRRFFLSYAAPVVANAAVVAALLWGGRQPQVQLAITAAIGSVVGSALQFLVQLPLALRLVAEHRTKNGPVDVREHVLTVVRTFSPVFVSRGVVQISGYIDALLASFLGTGAVAAIAYAQTLYMLPVSLFGMSVSAAELPAMSSALGTSDEIAAALRSRLERGLQQIAFFVIPSAAAFLVLGNVVVATIYRSGRFTAQDVTYVWAVLAGSSVGLLASTSGRLYSSAFYALRDTRTPLNFAIIRVSLTLALGYLCALPLPRLLHIEQRWGAAGLTLSAGIAGWIEFALLRRSLHQRIGVVPYPLPRIWRMWGAALVAAGVSVVISAAISVSQSLLAELVRIAVLGCFGMVYFALTHWLNVSQLASFRLLRKGR